MKLLKKMILSGFTLAIIGGFGLQAGDATAPFNLTAADIVVEDSIQGGISSEDAQAKKTLIAGEINTLLNQNKARLADKDLTDLKTDIKNEIEGFSSAFSDMPLSRFDSLAAKGIARMVLQELLSQPSRGSMDGGPAASASVPVIEGTDLFVPESLIPEQGIHWGAEDIKYEKDKVESKKQLIAYSVNQILNKPGITFSSNLSKEDIKSATNKAIEAYATLAKDLDLDINDIDSEVATSIADDVLIRLRPTYLVEKGLAAEEPLLAAEEPLEPVAAPLMQPEGVKISIPKIEAADVSFPGSVLAGMSEGEIAAKKEKLANKVNEILPKYIGRFTISPLKQDIVSAVNEEINKYVAFRIYDIDQIIADVATHVPIFLLENQNKSSSAQLTTESALAPVPAEYQKLLDDGVRMVQQRIASAAPIVPAPAVAPVPAPEAVPISLSDNPFDTFPAGTPPVASTLEWFDPEFNDLWMMEEEAAPVPAPPAPASTPVTVLGEGDDLRDGFDLKAEPNKKYITDARELFPEEDLVPAGGLSAPASFEPAFTGADRFESVSSELNYDPFAELEPNVDLGGGDWSESVLSETGSKSVGEPLPLLQHPAYNPFDLIDEPVVMPPSKEETVLLRNKTGDLFLDDVKDFDENALDSSSAPTPAFVPKPVGEASTEPSDLVEANNVVAVEAALRAAGSNYSDIIGWGLGDKQARLSIGESSRDSSPVGTPSTLSRTPSFSDLSSHSDSDTDGAAIDDDDLLGGTPPSSPKSLPKASPNAASVDLSGVNLVDLEAELLKNGPVEHMTNIYATTILENNLAAKVKLNKEWDIEL